jgi:hypothetical protein
MSINAFLAIIGPSIRITAGFVIFTVVVIFIFGSHASEKARISAGIALIIIFLGTNIFVSWRDWNISRNYLNIYARATSGTFALSDPLQKNSDNKWISTSNCKFIGGAYQASSTQQNLIYGCIANATSFRNFAYQVRINYIHGDYGCIDFRTVLSDVEKSYLFCIGSDGSYEFIVVKPNQKIGIVAAQEDFSPAINTALNQINSIAVVAQGTELYMFINTVFVLSMNDNTSSQGSIGVAALDHTNSTEVAFSNVQVWTL